MAKDEVNPDWTDAIKKAMHESVANLDNDNGDDEETTPSPRRSPSISPSREAIGRHSPVAPPPPLNLNTNPFRFSFPSMPSHPSGGTAQKSDSESSISSASESSRSHRSKQRSQRFKARRESQKDGEEREKFELLSRLHHLEQEKGYNSFRTLNAHDSIHDIRYEFFRAQREIMKRTSVKLMQKYLITFTSIVEMVAQWYNPFNLKLGGYSKSVLLSMKEYEPILEELHYKYSESVSIGPELKLVMALASSIFFYHTGHNLSYESSSTSAAVPVPPSVPKPSQDTMRGPRGASGVASTNRMKPPSMNLDTPSFNPLSMMMPMMMGSGTAGSGSGSGSMGGMNFGDIMSGLNMVQTIMKNPKLDLD